MPNKPVVDPWLVNADGSVDPFASTIDFGMTRDDEINPDEDISLDIHPGLTPDVVIAEGGVVRQPEPVVETPPPPPEPEGPVVINLDDGGSITLDKEKGQWKATLDPGNGANPEVFWGKNKDGLIANVLTAKLNATKKIRELNKQVKLGNQPARQPSQQQAPAPVSPTTGKPLTADELFEIQTLMQSNPDQAIETWFQKKYGRNFGEVVNRSDRGAQADANLRTEAVCRNFLVRNPDWYNDPESQNFVRLIQWLSKYKLGKVLPDNTDVTPAMFELDSTGWFTVESLEEAFSDLSGDGFLIKAPKPPKAPQHVDTPPPVVVSQEPVPAPRPDERIVRTETRPRAALGIRASDVTPVAAPAAETAPSVEDLNDLSDDQVKGLLHAIKRQKLLARRSN
jgi:hypothetical protein